MEVGFLRTPSATWDIQPKIVFRGVPHEGH